MFLYSSTKVGEHFYDSSFELFIITYLYFIRAFFVCLFVLSYSFLWNILLCIFILFHFLCECETQAGQTVTSPTLEVRYFCRAFPCRLLVPDGSRSRAGAEVSMA